MRRTMLALLGTLGAAGCSGGSDSPFDGNEFPVPVSLGGLSPVEGGDRLDASFAGTGVRESFAFVARQPVRVLADRSARLLVVGVAASPHGLRVERLTEAGESDATFGAGGVFLLPDATPWTTAYAPRPAAVIVDESDRILIAFTRATGAGARHATVVRLDPQGFLDPNFGAEGIVVLAPVSPATETWAVDLALDASEGILVCADELGPEGPRTSVMRLDDAGATSDDFGELGIARGPEDEPSTGARVTTDVAGRIVVAGSLPEDRGRVALWRFDAEGVPDPLFGVDGLATLADADVSIDLSAVDAATDAAGRIVVLGERARDLPEIDAWPLQLVDFVSDTAPVFDVLVWRFASDGAPDPTFGVAGAQRLAFQSGPYVPVSGGLAGGDHFDAAAGLFLDEAESVVVAGWSDPATWWTALGWATFGPTRPFVARLTASGTLDPSFHGAGHAQLGWDFAGATHARGHPTSLTRDPVGRWVLAGGSENGSSQRVWRVSP